jgi:hypothetical protein
VKTAGNYKTVRGLSRLGSLRSDKFERCLTTTRAEYYEFTVRGKTTTECRSRDELGGAKAHRRTVSMTFMMLGRTLELFSRHLSQILRLQTASRHRPIAFAPEGSSLDRCLPVNNPGYEFTVETSSRHTCSVFDSMDVRKNPFMLRESQHERDGIIGNSSTYPLVLSVSKGEWRFFLTTHRSAVFSTFPSASNQVTGVESCPPG